MRTKLSFLAVVFAALFTFTACDQRPPAPPVSATVEPTIFEIIAEGDTTAFITWLEHAPDLNLREADGTTLLMTAVLHDKLGYTLDLIGRGADIHLADENGATALHVAAMLGRISALSLLIESGADLHAVNKDGLSAFDLATLLDQPEAAALLANARAGVFSVPSFLPESEESEATPEAAIVPPQLLSTDFRIWTSASGEQMDAAFIQNIFDSVMLQNREGVLFRIPLNRLAPADQATVRQLSGVDPQALARNRLSSTPTAPAKPLDGKSIGLRIGKEKGWTVLENCRLVTSGGNDGDSFYAKHEGKEYIFRLYFVDAAETVMSYPDRVRQQAEYFGLSDDETIKLGEAAKSFTSSLLASSPFTVVTQWEDAKGNSRLPRNFALVVTPQGDLDELLTRAGLVRQYGMPVRSAAGSRKKNVLIRLEREAKKEKAGAWKRGTERQASRS